MTRSLLPRDSIKLAALAWSCLVSPCGADDVPFATFNQSPLVQIYGLPALGGARIVKTHETRLDVVFAAANHMVAVANAAEALQLDGETHRTTLRLVHGLGHAAEIGVELPYVSHSGGFLDNFIENWHDTFGLPEGGRHAVASDQLTYRYQRNGVDRIRLGRSTSGMGDVRVGGALQLAGADTGGNDVALRASVKLPTGDSARLHGSGAPDVAAWLSAGCGQLTCGGAFSGYGGGGVLWLGNGDVLPDQQRRGVAFGSAGLHWRALPRLTLTAQLDAHTPFYRDSGLVPLRSSSAQLVLGGTWFVGRKLALEVAVSEDVVVDTAPDVVIQIGLRTSF